MLYFIRRPFDLDNDKALHKKQLRKSIYTILFENLKSYGIELNENSILYNEYGKPFLKDRKDLYFKIQKLALMPSIFVNAAPALCSVLFLKEKKILWKIQKISMKCFLEFGLLRKALLRHWG